MSPHLTIYKPQVTSMLSITHRGTGLAQSVILSGFAIFGITSNYSYPWLLSQVAQLQAQLGIGGGIICLAKFAIAWPVCFHLYNGLRHLVSFFFSSKNSTEKKLENLSIIAKKNNSKKSYL